jgi:hypothetical protein
MDKRKREETNNIAFLPFFVTVVIKLTVLENTKMW